LDSEPEADGGGSLATWLVVGVILIVVIVVVSIILIILLVRWRTNSLRIKRQSSRFDGDRKVHLIFTLL
jgi:membrane protein YdbS with pleckstrin-like domain